MGCNCAKRKTAARPAVVKPPKEKRANVSTSSPSKRRVIRRAVR